VSGTLSLYVARRFLGAFLSAFGAVLIIVVLIDLVELMRKGADSDAGFGELLALALLHAPSIMSAILPFITLLASMACFARLARASELVVTRAAGVSVWRLLTPTIVSAGMLGVIGFALYNPVAAGMLQSYETQRAKFFDDRTSLFSISRSGLWLREGNAKGQTVIRAKRTGSDGENFWDVTLMQFDRNDGLASRIEAGRAILGHGEWELYQVRRWRFDKDDASRPLTEENLETLNLPTLLTKEQILDSFSAPEAISFWKLTSFIEAMEQSGFSATRHRMFLQSQLAAPLLFAAMVLIGAAFSMRHVRFGGLGIMALGCVLTGIGYFFLANVAQAFGNSGAIAAPLAAWIPPLAMSLLAIGLLLHLEDG
jgi:lipopolysaccharide export system permease protein